MMSKTFYTLKLILLTFATIFMFMPSFEIQAQDRVNRKPATFEMISQLKRATGWRLSPEGQWESSQNKILNEFEESQQFLHQMDGFRHGTDNFTDFTFYNGYINGVKYIVFVKNFTSGRYIYPAIHEGWYAGPYSEGYAFDIEQLSNIEPPKDEEINVVELDAFDYKSLDHVNKEKALSIYKKSLNPEDAEKAHAKLFIAFKPNFHQNTVRFIIFNKIKNSTLVGDLAGGYESISEDSLDKTFSKFYYETTYSSFKSFLLPLYGTP